MGDKILEKYRYFSHTADIGLDVFGQTLSEIFVNAAEGLYSLLFERKPSSLKKETITISLSGNDTETLLVQWLNELIYSALMQKLYFDEFVIIELSEHKLTAELKGFNFECCLKREIKAATYHNLKINKTNFGFEAKIIFDV